MKTLSVRILLIVCTLIGFLALVLETIAFVNDILWNNWVNDEIRKNNGRPPVSLIARESSRKRSVEEINHLIELLRRDRWMEPCAFAIMIITSLLDVALCTVYFLGKITASSMRMSAILSILSLCHLVVAALITTSVFYYDTSYYILGSESVTYEGKLYGNYHELHNCELNANIVLQDRKDIKPIKNACQLHAEKISAAVFTMVANLTYLGVFVAAILNLKKPPEIPDRKDETNANPQNESLNSKEWLASVNETVPSDHEPPETQKERVEA